MTYVSTGTLALTSLHFLSYCIYLPNYPLLHFKEEFEKES